MKQEINPKETNRAHAFEMWMKSPMPMVTLTKTFDVTHLYKASKRRNVKFNTLLCWCIGHAASKMTEFYLLPEQGTLFQYDRLAINVIVNNKEGDINSCDIPYSDNFDKFCTDYTNLTLTTSASCQSIFDEEAAIIGTSTVMATELDCIVNQYSGIFNNPFLAWGKYRKSWLRTTLPISFQFHHVQMDGGHAARFLEELQQTINTI
ncbi:chloramphenicol O-acetyltransferase type A [Xylanibacter ruminicola]|uniref:Chloramphenicol O-acetyltransferase type A n=1 Tax=Xylanibacter ruminicola TaxID=839 RepID=A0A1H5SHK4_XYLRU|nr:MULTISPECIES: CatA-like O-acetyltransferase, family 2 [Prevotellaceae]SEF49227.1 chloramphenicol O-acetyltransferase type A [Xylanibacter ruminicola]